MSLTVVQKNRMVRREREQLSVQCHYQHLNDALENMHELSAGEIDQESRHRFAMYAAIADRHWRVVAH